MNPESLVLYLMPAEADPSLRSPEYQRGLKEVQSALTAQGVKVSSLVELEESAGSETIWLGKYTIELVRIAGPVLPVLGAIVGAWLQARYGRKARLKIGDIEAEARTVDEVEKLLAHAKRFHQAK
jgi:hypothetical protein